MRNRRNAKKISEARNAKTKNQLVLQGNYGYGWDDLCYYDDTPEGRRERKEDYQTYIENEPNARFRTIERRVANPNYVASNVDVESLKLRIKPVRSLVRENFDNSIEIAFITPNLDVANAVTDKARELGGFGSTWSETRWAYVDTPDTQDVNKIDKLIDFAQNNGAYINAPTAKKLTAKYGFRFD